MRTMDWLVVDWVDRVDRQDRQVIAQSKHDFKKIKEVTVSHS